MLYFIVIFLILLAGGIGFVTGYVMAKEKPLVIGDFVINKSDPSKDLFSIRFEKDLDEFEDSDFITFNVIEK